MGFSEHLAALLRQDPKARAVQHDGGWFPWGEAAGVAGGVDKLLTAARLGAGATVGLVMRERPWSVAGFYALLATRRATLMFSGRQPDAALAQDIATLRPAALIADAEDWRREALVAEARAAGVLGIALTHDPAEPVRLVASLEQPGPGPHHALPDGCAVTMLTSGTTGPAKRIPVWYDELDARQAKGRPSSGVAINALPLYNMGGIFGLVDAVVRSRPVSIMERFDVRRWAELIREHKPKQTGSPPSVLRMVLDADIPPDYFASVESHVTASAPLDVQVAKEFERRYGVACFQGWGATEMKGSATGWGPEDRTAFKEAKLGSCGRALPGVELRIVDPDTAAPCPVGVDGRIEVWRADFPGDDHWMTTNDLGHVDEDGFLWVKGRLDDVIIRGGLKVDPKDVDDALREHPGVAEAVTVGIPDERLGEAPVTAIVAAGEAPDEQQLIEWLRERLPAYKVPIRIVAVDQIPRNPMMKVERRTLRTMLQDRLV
ncbi:MAG: long-chain fatty acid--CoA ligase [Caulobacteraceae bacterium]|nr:long-chain fatty acid--CoA ligase [Caulobacteraceae bacterium]